MILSSTSFFSPPQKPLRSQPGCSIITVAITAIWTYTARKSLALSHIISDAEKSPLRNSILNRNWHRSIVSYLSNTELSKVSAGPIQKMIFSFERWLASHNKPDFINLLPLNTPPFNYCFSPSAVCLFPNRQRAYIAYSCFINTVPRVFSSRDCQY